MNEAIISPEDLGLNEFFTSEAQEYIDQGFSLARVTSENRGIYLVRDEFGEMPAEVIGKLMFEAYDRLDYPAVGDWVAIRKLDGLAMIHYILPRRAILVRKVAGKRIEAQVIATNVDIVFLVMALDHNFNLRRLERYLVFARESGTEPVILLTKVDLCGEEHFIEKLHRVKEIAPDITVLAVSSFNNEGLDDLRKLIRKGITFCLVGSSGVGKSTLINTLLSKEVLKTSDVREKDSKGRHTTTQKQMFFLLTGGILIDTPGMRELGLWDVSSGLSETFEDITDLAAKCKYTDCSHINEPGCAVVLAVENGALEAERYHSYLKLVDESKRLQFHQIATNSEKKQKAKKRCKDIRKILQSKGKK